MKHIEDIAAETYTSFASWNASTISSTSSTGVFSEPNDFSYYVNVYLGKFDSRFVTRVICIRILV